ncbi:MAG: 2-dehydro-3-deoxyglucarate aldolase [Chloroflexi bacterium]|nr:2-dehydro-3-deoxyglucarate aldolase [Chloroflexota bacterium]
MDSNPVKDKLNRGEASVGTWSTTGDPSVVEILAHMSDLDWITVDFEHNAIDVSTAVNCLRAAQGSDKPMFARVPYVDKVWIKRILDIGFMGIVVPDVKNADQAREAVKAAKYAPEGLRGIGSARGQIAYGPGFYEKANDMTMVVIMIEDPVAVEQIDEIMSVKGVDVCFVGPNDLAQTLGVPIGLNNKHPDHIAAVQKVIDAGKRHGVATGAHTASGEEASRRIKQGMQWFPISSDAGLLRAGVDGQLAEMRAGLAGELGENDEDGGTFY